MIKVNRRWLHVAKYIKCWLHQPFVQMQKSTKFLGYICPKCGNMMDAIWRGYQLKKLNRSID